MFHDDIMNSVMRERARDMRARAQNARQAGEGRRLRRFWAEEVAQRAAAPVVGRRSRARRAAAAAGR